VAAAAEAAGLREQVAAERALRIAAEDQLLEVFALQSGKSKQQP
jgi:hypothetical protein